MYLNVTLSVALNNIIVVCISSCDSCQLIRLANFCKESVPACTEAF